MNKSTKNNIILILSLTVLLMLGAGTLFIWNQYIQNIESKDDITLMELTEYDRHYVLIPDNNATIIWDDIYQSAKQAAKKDNAYLEYFGDWEAGDYTPLDYLKLATAAKVDGIILKPDGTAAMREAIDDAVEAGIPVIAVLNDDSKSARHSYVGPNTYQMGTTYGSEIVKCINANTRKIMVLQRNNVAGKELIFKELKSVVQEKLRKNSDIQIENQVIISGNAFDVEEAIRDILYREENRPDILVCMDITDSESAYHTMIDYNLVDKVNIIGYYQTDIQLDAITKDTMPAVITIDTEQVGISCIEALEEYHKTGYVSSYYSVELDAINSGNIEYYLKKRERGQDGE